MRLGRGLIPAHAGKTSRPRIKPSMTRAHPRSRGENCAGTSVTGSTAGSSPLTRGKLTDGGEDFGRGRLIPAHAGKTSCSSRSSRASRAHPRSRGENPRRSGTRNLKPGSSPLTRGKRLKGTARRKGQGLIPAHAGKTARWGPACTRSPAHPRSRGENGAAAVPPSQRPGSSPLTRGKLHRDCLGSRRRGLIPAHAGKTDLPSIA